MIRKIACVLLLVVSFSGTSYPQKIRYGLTIGLSSSHIKEAYDKEFVYGLCGGLIVDYNFSKKFAIHSGLLYLKNGVEGELSSWDLLQVITPIDMRVEYLEIPIVLKYNLIRNLYIGLGPYFALKIGGDLTLYGDEERNNWIKQEDIGYVLAAGIDFNLLRKKHFFEVRFNRGITAVVADDHNMVLAFIYGLYF